MGVIEGRRLALEVGEEVVAEVELDLAGCSDDHLARDVEEEPGDSGDDEKADGVEEDLLLGEAMAHVVDGVADDDGHEHLEDVVDDVGDATPGERF